MSYLKVPDTYGPDLSIIGRTYLDAIPVACGFHGVAPLVDCLERGEAFARSGGVVGGDIIDMGDARPLDEYARSVEAEFQTMKQLAQAAKWPADLSPKIMEIDAAWQAAKRKANADKVSVAREVGMGSPLRKSIGDMVLVLQGRLPKGNAGEPSSVSPWLVGGAVAASIGVLWAIFRRD